MTDNPESTGAKLGRVFFLSGRPARGKAERVQALTEKERYWREGNLRQVRKRQRLRYPNGLAEIRSTGDGQIVRVGGVLPMDA